MKEINEKIKTKDITNKICKVEKIKKIKPPKAL